MLTNSESVEPIAHLESFAEATRAEAAAKAQELQ